MLDLKGYSLEQAKVSVGNGWGSIINEAYVYLEGLPDKFKVVQVKEKFGGLRIYISLASDPQLYNTTALIDAVHGLDKIVEKAIHICEECGDPGKTTQTAPYRWIKTLCQKHERPV